MEDMIYYSPEKFGLTVIGEIEWGGEPWGFDLTVIWHDDEGNLYMGEDAGCSCPVPFENNTRQDFQPVDFKVIESHLNNHHDGSRAVDVAELVGRIRAYLDSLSP
jgi:hypothetical protein